MVGWGDLSAREEEVLAAVGRRLANGEIAAEMYVSVRTVESHIAALRRKLAVDNRAGLIEAAARRRPAVVPLPQNSFVGREDDLAGVEDLIHRSRVVTVVGPAGAGKTRLALEIAARSDASPIVVDLADAEERDVERSVARAIGVGADASDELMTMAAVALTGRAWLLVLDNCDRLTSRVRDAVSTLLLRAPTVRVLATSRSPLGGTDEAVYPLATLAVDDPGAAVRLFRDRAAASAPRTPLTDEDDELVAQVCRRLDGLPLAIELAAARLRHLSLTDLASRLEEGFGALERGGVSDRHRTLEAALGWTWDLLEDDERELLSTLAALPRGLDLELARVVGGPDADEVTLRLLERSLVTQSMGRAPARGQSVRYRLLEPVRAFVLARTDPDVVTRARDLHAAHFASLSGWLSDKARIDDSASAKADADRVCPDVNAALTWSMDQRRDEYALQLTRALSIGVEQYEPDVDSIDALTQAAKDPRLLSSMTARDLFNLGCALSLGDLALVDDLAARALAGADDDASRMAAECLAGYADAYQDRGPSALEHLALAEAIALELDDTWQLASIRQARGIALWSDSLGDPVAALDAFEAAMQTYALAGDAMHVNNCRYMMAAAAAEAGIRIEQARAWAEQCIAYTRATENDHELAHAILARNALLPTASAEELQSITSTFRSAGDLHCLTRTYLRLADVSPVDQQVALLHLALDIARVGHHSGRQIEALERLVTAQWDGGQRHAAAVALGQLSLLVGDEAALAACPDGLHEHLDEWAAAIAEGRALAASSTSPDTRGVAAMAARL